MQKFEKKTGFHERRKTSLDINNSTSTNSTPASATKTIITPSTSEISIARTNDKVKLFLKKVMHLLKKRNKALKLPFPCQNQAGNENNSSFFLPDPTTPVSASGWKLTFPFFKSFFLPQGVRFVIIDHSK